MPANTGCRVDLLLRFAFANRLTGMVFEPLFEETAASLVDAFVARARELAAVPGARP
jgi:ribosome-associated toxin RatA of RatAB toxin-antitoxin module